MENNGRQSQAGARKVVIVVEDEPVIGALIADAISDEPGYCAIHVAEAGAALEATKHVAPDVMVVDVRLPGMSGFELYDRLKKDPRTSKIPVLFETASGTEAIGEFREALRLNSTADNHYSLAACLMSLGRNDEALSELETASKLDPDRTLYRARREELLKLMKDTSR